MAGTHEAYPPGYVKIAMENHHVNHVNGKIHYQWSCSIAMFNHQRVEGLVAFGSSVVYGPQGLVVYGLISINIRAQAEAQNISVLLYALQSQSAAK